MTDSAAPPRPAGHPLSHHTVEPFTTLRTLRGVVGSSGSGSGPGAGAGDGPATTVARRRAPTALVTATAQGPARAAVAEAVAAAVASHRCVLRDRNRLPPTVDGARARGAGVRRDGRC